MRSTCFGIFGLSVTCILSTFTLAPVGRKISEKERLNEGLLLNVSSTFDSAPSSTDIGPALTRGYPIRPTKMDVEGSKYYVLLLRSANFVFFFNATSKGQVFRSHNNRVDTIHNRCITLITPAFYLIFPYTLQAIVPQNL